MRKLFNRELKEIDKQIKIEAEKFNIELFNKKGLVSYKSLLTYGNALNNISILVRKVMNNENFINKIDAAPVTFDNSLNFVKCILEKKLGEGLFDIYDRKDITCAKRSIANFYIRKYIRLSLKSICNQYVLFTKKNFGKHPDHTTIINSLNEYENYMLKYPNLLNLSLQIDEEINKLIIQHGQLPNLANEEVRQHSADKVHN